jgi:type I restriction enzyme S subunit
MSDDITLDEFTESDGKEPSEFVDEGLREEGFLTLPHDWDISTVREVSKEGGLVDGDWIESADMDENGAIQLVQLGHIGEGRFKGKPNRFITKEFAEQEDCTVLSEGDLLISRMQEPILRSCILPSFEQDSVMAVDIARLQEGENWNRMLLKYLFNSRPIWKQGIAWASGTTRKRISRKNIEKLRLPTPPLSEQRKIATVLHTVDQAIQKTKEVIEQTERTQKGHIRHLFRKGVSDEATETHEVLGEMPTSWKITELSNIADVVMGSSPKSEYYNESGDGLPFYQGNNDFNRRNPTTNVWCTDPVKQAKKGDILISIRAPVGDLNIATEDSCIGRGLAAIRPQSIDFDYLYYHLYERNNWFSRISSGSTFDSINSSQIRNTKIKLPSKSIQEKIGSILRNNELYILKEEEYLNQLQRLKQGLMQDLLSGEVRTTDANIHTPEEVAKYG